MGKNKGQKKTKEKAFTVVNTRKSKTKVVKTNLKKMNFQTKAKTDKADEKYKVLQEAVRDSVKNKTQPSDHQVKPKEKVVTHRDTEADMDTTTETFAKL